MTKPVLHLDFECFSEADIRKVGLENYLTAPGFAITVIAWAFNDEPVASRVWPHTRYKLPGEVEAHIHAGGEIRAHNAGFEHAILNDHYHVETSIEQMTCTMQKALAYGLPAGLLKAGRALGLKIVKDETKRLLMLQMGRPRKGAQPWHETDIAKLAHLCAYCEDDVRAERALDEAVPDLHPWEKKLSELDHRINRKGVRLDLDAVRTLRAAAGYALHEIDSECAALTQGAVTRPGSQTQKLMDWLQQNHTWLLNLSKEEVEEGLKLNLSPAVRRVLQLRQMAARSSVAKLDRMLDVASIRDDRARHLLQVSGAGRTLRWAGRLIQPQNLPRVGSHNAEQTISAAERDLGALGLLWGDPLLAISRSLRSCFTAKDSQHVLVAMDLSQIEARVLAWIAGQKDVLDAFRQGEDVYVLAAAKVGSSNRDLGKVLTLACGYGMGWMKFRETAAAAPYNVTLTAEQARNHLRTWRDLNGAITGLWGEVERVVRLSLLNPGAVMFLPRTMRVRTRNGVTEIRKPNGVKLVYHNMRLWKGDLIFDGVNSTTKAWGIEKAYGGRLVENIVQSVARDVMAEGMLAFPAVPVMTVHDEIVWELTNADAAMPVIPVPSWAPDLPIEAKLHIGFRYAK